MKKKAGKIWNFEQKSQKKNLEKPGIFNDFYMLNCTILFEKKFYPIDLIFLSSSKTFFIKKKILSYFTLSFQCYYTI